MIRYNYWSSLPRSRFSFPSYPMIAAGNKNTTYKKKIPLFENPNKSRINFTEDRKKNYTTNISQNLREVFGLIPET